MNYKTIFSILDLFIPKKNNIWIFLCQPGDITNTIAIYEYLINHKENNKHNLTFVWIGNANQKHFILNRFGEKTLFFERKSVKGLYYLLFSKIAFITHGPKIFLKSKRRKVINLWHGICLKNIGFLNNEKTNKFVDSNNYLYTTSQFDKIYFSATWQMKPNNIKVTGSPRLDLLYNFKKQNDNLNKILEIYNIQENYSKIGLFLPTFKNWNNENIQIAEGVSRKNNIFCFAKRNYNENNLMTSLIKNNFIILAKYHPFEEENIIQRYKNYNKPPIINIKTNDLDKLGITIYDFMGATDFLFTDYSSIALEYIILNKPIFHIIPDIEEYKMKRGIISDPFDFWLPGKKIYTYEELIEIINNNFKLTKQEWEAQNLQKKIRIKHIDNENSKRIFKDIMTNINQT